MSTDHLAVVNTVLNPLTTRWEIRSTILNVCDILSTFEQGKCSCLGWNLNNEARNLGRMPLRSSLGEILLCKWYTTRQY